jgi:hypothetical protein
MSTNLGDPNTSETITAANGQSSKPFIVKNYAGTELFSVDKNGSARVKAINKEYSATAYGSITAAIAAWVAGGGGKVLIEAGTWAITTGGELSFPDTSETYKGLIMEGQGPSNTIITYDGTGSLFDISTTWITLKDVQLLKIGGDAGTGTAINLDPAFNCTFDNIIIENSGTHTWGVGINFDQEGSVQSGNNTISNTLVMGCATGIVDNARTNYLRSVTVKDCTTYLVELENGGNRYIQCTFGGTCPIGIHARPSGEGVVVQHPVFEGCWFENNAIAMYFEGGFNPIIRNCWIHSASVTGPTINMDSVVSGEIDGCTFSNETGSTVDVLLNNCTSINIKGCASIFRGPACVPIVTVTGNITTCAHNIDCRGLRHEYADLSRYVGSDGAIQNMYLARSDYGICYAVQALRNTGLTYDPALYLVSGQTAPEPPDILIPGRVQMQGQLVLRTKSTAGAPDDSTYGWVTGALVFNSNENKLYVRGTGGWVEV